MRKTIFGGIVVISLLICWIPQSLAAKDIESVIHEPDTGKPSSPIALKCAILDRDDNPIPNQRIQLRPGNTQESIRTVTDAHGIFSAQIPPGRYSLMLSDGPAPNIPTRYRLQTSLSITREDPSILKLRNIYLTGSIKDLRNIPIPDARIIARSIDTVQFDNFSGQFDSETTSDVDGIFRLAVFPGTISLRVDPPEDSGLAPVLLDSISVMQDGSFPVALARGELDKVKEYAPILWLATYERLYPMMPHPFAFDGIDNDGDGLTDLEDPIEVEIDSKQMQDVYRFIEELRELKVETDVDDALKSDLEHGVIRDALQGVFEKEGIALSKYASIKRTGDQSWEINSYEVKGPSIFIMDRRCLTSPGLIAALGKKGIPLSQNYKSLEVRSGDSTDWVITDELEKWDSRKVTHVYIIKERQNELHVCNGRKQTYSISIRGTRATIMRQGRLPPPKVGYCTASVKRGQRDMELYQYWFYYLFDEGFAGHMHDSEHAFVFVTPDDGEVKCVVGAGHTSATANNILVSFDSISANWNAPERLPKHMPILVELGKHASAPDKDMNGRFDFGIDANVFPEYAWGSRDVAAATGTAKGGEFREVYSYIRDEKGLILEESWQDSSYIKDYRLDVPRPDDIRAYELYSLEHMRELYEQLEHVKVDEKIEMEKWLESRKSFFWGKNAPTRVELDDRAFENMRKWTESGRDTNRVLWEHNDFKNPNDIFKLWLFPVVVGEFTILGYGSGIPRIGLAVRYCGLKPSPRLDSFGVHFDLGLLDNKTKDISIIYSRFAGMNYGVYGGFGWGNIREVNSCAIASTGVMFAWDLELLRHTQIVQRLGLRGEIHHRSNPGEWELDPIELQYSISLTRNLKGPRHPLVR